MQVGFRQRSPFQVRPTRLRSFTKRITDQARARFPRFALRDWKLMCTRYQPNERHLAYRTCRVRSRSAEARVCLSKLGSRACSCQAVGAMVNQTNQHGALARSGQGHPKFARHLGQPVENISVLVGEELVCFVVVVRANRVQEREIECLTSGPCHRRAGSHLLPGAARRRSRGTGSLRPPSVARPGQVRAHVDVEGPRRRRGRH